MPSIFKEKMVLKGSPGQCCDVSSISIFLCVPKMSILSATGPESYSRNTSSLAVHMNSVTLWW